MCRKDGRRSSLTVVAALLAHAPFSHAFLATGGAALLVKRSASLPNILASSALTVRSGDGQRSSSGRERRRSYASMRIGATATVIESLSCTILKGVLTNPRQ
ncbi:hypothetical protein JKP88DRAFT_250533, partial [Tribonema minus]